MIQVFTKRLRKFRSAEDGALAFDFVLWFPFFLILMLFGVEVGLLAIKHVKLERSMDDTVRYVRLNTGGAPSHAELKTKICATNPVADCENNLLLEMQVQDLRNWDALPDQFACTDRSEEIQPMGEFSHGMDNELIVLRVCAKFKPLFSASLFGNAMVKDGAGDAMITKSTAFVQEPR